MMMESTTNQEQFACTKKGQVKAEPYLFDLGVLIGHDPDADTVCNILGKIDEFPDFEIIEELVDRHGGGYVAAKALLLSAQRERGVTHDSGIAWLRTACNNNYAYSRADKAIIRKRADAKLQADARALEEDYLERERLAKDGRCSS